MKRPSGSFSSAALVLQVQSSTLSCFPQAVSGFTASIPPIPRVQTNWIPTSATGTCICSPSFSSPSRGSLSAPSRSSSCASAGFSASVENTLWKSIKIKLKQMQWIVLADAHGLQERAEALQLAGLLVAPCCCTCHSACRLSSCPWQDAPAFYFFSLCSPVLTIEHPCSILYLGTSILTEPRILNPDIQTVRR